MNLVTNHCPGRLRLPAPRPLPALLLWALLLGIGTPVARAADDGGTAAQDSSSLWLTTGFWSHHTQQRRTREYRRNNTGIGLQWQFAPAWQVNAGHYRNSVDRPSNYLQLGWSPLHWQPAQHLAFSAGASVGVVNGYPNIADGYFATLVPMTTVEWRRLGLNLVYIPSAGRIHGGYAAQLKLKMP
jgi:hypothetical protein